MKTLSQIINRLSKWTYAEQRAHLVREYIRMRRAGAGRKRAREVAQFGVDTILGQYRRIDYTDLLRETITLVDAPPDGSHTLLAVCRPPQGGTRRATLEIIASGEIKTFPSVLKAHRYLCNTLYRDNPSSYFDDAKGLQYG